MTRLWSDADNNLMGGSWRLRLTVAVFLLLSLSGVLMAPLERVSGNPDLLKWSIVDTPSGEDFVVVSPSEISALGVGADDESFYAVDTANSVVYASSDGGVTWTDRLTDTISAKGAALPAWDVVVAPAESELIAVVTDSRTALYVSDDGGETWYDMQLPDLGAMLVGSVAISPEYDSGERDIAVGTRNPTSLTDGDVWVRKLFGLGTWRAQGLDMDVSTVRFSHSYYSERVLLAVGSDSSGTYLCTGVRNTEENSTDWEVSPSPKVEVSTLSGESPKKDELQVSDLAMPGDFLGSDTAKRVVYVGYSSDTEFDDIYRIDFDTPSRLNVKHGERVAIASIAFDGTCGGGNLLAGLTEADAGYAEAQVRMCSNPTDCFPTWEKPSKFKAPTGGAASGRASALVAWSPGSTVAYCGTSTNWVESAADWPLPTKWNGQALDESAFSITRDGGDTWNQLSLIDTETDELVDLAFSPDYEALYLGSHGAGFDSVWRTESVPLGDTWERVLCPEHRGDIMLRQSPGAASGERLFFAMAETGDARYSADRGRTWESVWECPNVSDLAVANRERFYVLDDTVVHTAWWDAESWGGIWEWQRDVETGLTDAYSIGVSGSRFVFVGGEPDEDRAAYSTDGGRSFELTEPVPEPGETLMAPDGDFARNRILYAASSAGKLYRWTIGGSTSWRRLNPPQSGFVGVAEKAGALYGAYDSGVARTLVPHAETLIEADWDSLELGLPAGVSFKSRTLKAVEAENIDLWVIDGRDYDFESSVGCLWVYSDSFALEIPWPTAPMVGEFLTCDICYCRARPFCFRWLQVPQAQQYELWVALDDEFLAVIHEELDFEPVDCCNPSWCYPEDAFRFVCGETYYWRVRASSSTEGERIHSRWSPTMYFSVDICSTAPRMHVAPILGVPVSGDRTVSRSPAFSWTGFVETERYEFMLAEDADFRNVLVKEETTVGAFAYPDELAWGTTYFWSVRAVAPVPSEAAVASFTVLAEPRVPKRDSQLPPAPIWVWVVVGLLGLLVVLILCYWLATRR